MPTTYAKKKKTYAQLTSEATNGAITDDLLQTVSPLKKKGDITCVYLDPKVYHPRLELWKILLNR